MKQATRSVFKWVRLLVALALTLMTFQPLMPVGLAYASTSISASLIGGTGTTEVGGTLYARNGGALTLNVTTSTGQNKDATRCVKATGALAGTQTNNQTQGSWSLPFTAGAGDGPQQVTVTAYSDKQCSNDPVSTTVSFVLDNTGPVVTAALAPAPNAAGWNKSNVSITWSATDAGSGVATGPTPATDSVTADIASVVKTSTATDRLGNSTTGSVTVKLDKSAPTITGSASPAAVNGWNKSDVTVSFTCADVGPSGIKSCSGPTTLSTSAANQAVTGTAVDNADNSTSATVGGINIDKVAPTLSGAPTTNPNTAGWYNGDVTVAWTCSDALSGIAGSCPANSTIGGVGVEGQGLSASASVSDKAGNTTTATSSPAVNIDKTAPNTTVSAPPAWNNNSVTVTFNPSDALSGVKETDFILDGVPQSGTSVTINSEGIHNLEFWSVDKAGNEETHKTVQVKIDKTPPTISHTQAPTANAHGWNNGAVTVTFVCGDALSGVASCTGWTGSVNNGVTVTTEGQGQAVTGTAVDNAGNSATDPATVSIDKTAPTISATRNPTANGNGWNNSDVTVTYACADQAGLSGIDTCTTQQTFGEGASQTATGTAVDAAGNSAGASVAGINVDKTAPVLTGAATASPNTNGWYQGDVTVHWTCGDGLSGIDGNCPADSVVTGEGASLSASASVNDKAGNTTNTTVTGLKIDRTAPSTSVTPPSGWSNATVVLDLATNDALSGVAATYFILDSGSQQSGTHVEISSDGVHTLKFWSVDYAGNIETQNSVTVKVDQTSPTINHMLSPAANAKGWNNAPVTVTFACSDATSGVASCTGSQTVSTEGASQPVPGTATDNAGNSATDPATVSVDFTPPTITAATDRAPNANDWYNDDVKISYTCVDSLSGVDVCPGPQTLGEGANQSASGTATDTAGNSASAGVSGINVDKTPPSISGAPTVAANSDGWYNGDVYVAWTCEDTLSGLDGACPATSTVAGEGSDLAASASVSDKAGNSNSASVSGINIDRKAPITTASAPSAWINTDATVTLDAKDGLSGVKTTYYTLDGGVTQTGTSIVIKAEGVHTIQYWSMDKAGNIEGMKTAEVKIDKTAPTITHSQSPDANTAGWNNTSVTVTFVCGDALSGVASCTGWTGSVNNGVAVTTEGQDQAVTGTAVDNAGNSATDPATVSIDKTAPTISGSASPAPNAKGWNNTDVTVKFTCADSLSGIAACLGNEVFNTDGANQSATGTALDIAGNSATATVSGIYVDETPPTIGGAPTTLPNGASWYKADVVVHWTCSDATSGLDGACPADSTITGEGDNLSASASVSDNAGNNATASVTGIHIDRTPPTTVADAPAGWKNTDVTVHLTASDAGSGVKATYYELDGAGGSGSSVAITTEGTHTLKFWSVDIADNTETAQSIVVKIDKTNPTITHTQDPAKNANGWNNTDVTVTFKCDDTLSGLASCTDPQALKNEGKDQTLTGTALDNAGNSATDTADVSIDKTPPTISAAPDRAPNSNGWYKADVKVSFTCDDTLSGVDTCPASQTLSEGASQSASGTVFDIAGNSASAGVSGINVDKTPPALSGKPTTDPNPAGWYKGDVTIHWTAADQAGLSGLDPATLPTDSTIGGEGTGLTASASVSDLAGNSTTATSSPAVNIDSTAPNTSATAPSNWVNSDVTVNLTAKDNLSGVKETHFVLDNGTPQTGNSVLISSEGMHTLEYWSVDNADNEEAHKNITISIDKTAPTISHVLSPLPNAAGWNNTNVTVTFSCQDQDNLSGLASCTAPQTVTSEGQAQSVLGTATDHAGNTATDPATVSVDKTPPTISGSASPAANANGWNNTDVTVHFTCDDALSGVKSCSNDSVLKEGAGQSVAGSVTDTAGNSASTTVSNINVDETAPTIGGKVTTSPNGNGWYKSDVTIHWTTGDALSGVNSATVPADSVVVGEGDNLSASASVSDLAGNNNTATVGGIKIDRHAPDTTSDAPSGWNKANVTVHFTALDALSGIAATYYTLDGGAPQSGSSVTISTDGIHTLVFWSVDKADNAETPKTATVKVDKTAPTISGAPTTSPNANGWYNGPVTVHFTCSDATSGLASCPADVTLPNDGANQSVTGTATDNAGNTASFTVSGINIDTTKPGITLNGITNDGVYTLGVVPAASCTATDGGSGLTGSCNLAVTGGTANGVGTFNFTATATDKAGNTTTVTGSYRVIYRWDGFLQPINDTAHQTGLATSVFKGGSTVPVKFQLKKADGTVVQANSLPVWVVPVKGAQATAAVDETVYTDTPTSGGTYRWSGSPDSQYIYNWSTKGFTTGYFWHIGVQLDDGQTYYVSIGLR